MRLNAAIALGKFGAVAKDAVPALINTTHEDPDGGISHAARNALESIGLPAIPALKAIVRDANRYTLEEANIRTMTDAAYNNDEWIRSAYGGEGGEHTSEEQKGNQALEPLLATLEGNVDFSNGRRCRQTASLLSGRIYS